MRPSAAGGPGVLGTRAIGYLITGGLLALATIVLAVPILVSCAVGRTSRPGQALVDWERRRCGIVLRRLIPHRPIAGRRMMAWIVWQVVVALPSSLAMTYLLVGGLNALTFPAWWAIIGTPPSGPLPGLMVETWSTAILIPLIGLAYLAALLLIGPWLGPLLAHSSLRILGLPSDPGPRNPAVHPHDGVRGAELRRIDRSIHDGVQAHLLNANMLIGIARQRPETAPELDEELRTAGAEITVALAELRTIITSLYPPALADRGLEQAVRALAKRSRATCTVRCDGLGDVPPEIEAGTYFGVAEAMSNAVRHGQCTEIDIVIERDPDRLYCSVTDNGLGGAAIVLDAQGGTGGSTGLAGLRSRVSEFAGRLTIDSPPGGPTRISWELPCVS